MKSFIKRVVSLVVSCCCTFCLSACGKKECEHNYRSEITNEATCCSNGIKLFTCSICGDSYTETMVATGNHIFTDSTIIKEPSCKETGLESYTCIISGKEYTNEIKKTDNHEYARAVIKPATDSVEGKRECTCSICGDSYTESFLLAKVEYYYPYIIELNDGGTVFCSVDSITISQDNTITDISVRFSVYSISDRVYLSSCRIYLNGAIRYQLNLGFVECEADEVIKKYTLESPISLSEGKEYELRIGD